jgi:hypothetical protein
MLSYCLFCSLPTANPHGFCSEECYDSHAVALEETQLIPALPDDECPLCGSADRCTCSYIPTDDPDAPYPWCPHCGEDFCVCDSNGSSWDDDYTIEPFDLWDER